MYIGNIKNYYNDDTGNVFRQQALDLLTMEIQGQQRTPGSLKEELIRAALDFNSQVPDLHIALSGGWESQVCLQTFIEAGLRPKVVIFQFPENLNDFDVEPALAACRRNNINPMVIKIAEFANFLRHDLVPAACKYQTYTFFQTLLATYLERYQINCLILDKVDLRRDMHPRGQWSFNRGETAMWPDRFNRVNDNKVYMNFFCHSAEAMLAYLKLPVITQLVQTPNSGKLSLQSLKHRIYKEGGFTNLPLFTRTIATDKIIALNGAGDDLIKKEFGLKGRIAYVEYENIIKGLQNEGVQRWQYII
jgi:hypothetical protein